MSVSVSVSNYIVPVFREPDSPGKQHVIARWHSEGAVAGDASAGYAGISHFFENVAGMFGPHCLWDLRFISGFISGAAVAVPFSSVLLYSAERTAQNSPTPLGLNYFYCCQWFATLQLIYLPNQIFPKFKFRLGETGLSQINHNIYTNQAGSLFTSVAGGYLYDERYLGELGVD
jgi:hypothetical protein